MQFDEKAFEDLTNQYDKYIDCILTEVNHIEQQAVESKSNIDTITQQINVLQQQDLILRRNFMLREQMTAKFEQNVNLIAANKIKVDRLTHFMDDYVLPEATVQALDDPFSDAFLAHIETFMKLLNGPNFRAVYERFIHQNERVSPLFQKMNRAHSIILKTVENGIQKAQLDKITLDPRVLIFAKNFDAVTESYELRAVQETFQNTVQQQLNQALSKFEATLKIQFFQAYPPTVCNKPNHVAEFSIFMPNIAQSNSKKFQFDAQILNSIGNEPLFGMTQDKVLERLQVLYANGYNFYCNHLQRSSFFKHDITIFPKKPLSMSMKLQKQKIMFQKQQFDQSVHPEHIANQIMIDADEMLQTLARQYQETFAEKLRYDFAWFYERLFEIILLHAQQFDFVGSCNFVKQTKTLMETLIDTNLTMICHKIGEICGTRVLLFYKQMFGNFTKHNQKQVNNQIENLMSQYQIDQDDKMGMSEVTEQFVIDTFREFMPRDRENKPLPTAPILAFRIGYFLSTLKQLENTSFKNLYSAAISSFTKILIDKAQFIFYDIKQELVAKYCYSLIINLLAILNQMLGEVVDLGVYFDELDRFGGRDQLIGVAQK